MLKRSTFNVQRSTFNARGFTLIELIVAFTILALVGVIVFAALSFAVDAYDATQERLEGQARERILLDEVRRQIGSLFPVQPAGGFALNEQGDQLTTQLMNNQTPLFYGQYDFVTFITVAPLILNENPGLTVVRYGLAEDAYGDFYLGAMETRYSGIDSFSVMVNAPEGEPLKLVGGIEQLTFEYYGYDQQSQDYAWFESWNGEEMFSVPAAVRIRFNNDQIVVPVNTNLIGGGALGSRLRRMLNINRGTVGQ